MGASEETQMDAAAGATARRPAATGGDEGAGSGTSDLFDLFRIADQELEPWPETSERFLDGAQARGKVLYRAADGKRAQGIWRCTPGRVVGTFIADEVSFVPEGRMTVVDLSADSRYEVQAGDLLRIANGLEVEWIIDETLTKIWNVYHEDGLPF